jgi:hypothetical protein
VALFKIVESELRAHGLQESGLRHVLSEHLSRWVSFSEGGSLAQYDVTTCCTRLYTMLVEYGPDIFQCNCTLIQIDGQNTSEPKRLMVTLLVGLGTDEL